VTALLVPLSLCSVAASLPTEAVVRRVIDGDTIELSDGRLVRYIGVDAPEVRRRQGEAWVKDPEPFAQAATKANRRLVAGKTVRLERDAQTHDRYGQLLAYVYVEPRPGTAGPGGILSDPERGRQAESRESRRVGEVMVNAELLRLGLAQPLTIPPNVKHAERFRMLAQEARQARRGLWSRGPTD
jgi:micrococcal nuclease